MRTKDTILLEQAYDLVRESLTSRHAKEIDATHFKDNSSKEERLNGLIAGFHMNPNRQTALANINEAYLGKRVTLYKHGLGNAVDTYEGPTNRPVRQQELTQNDEVTGIVEKIHYTQDENGYHLIFVINGQSYDLTQDRYWVKPASSGSSDEATRANMDRLGQLHKVSPFNRR